MSKDLKEVSILMISLDAGLLSDDSSGDVVQRHKEYAGYLKRLDILVLAASPDKFLSLDKNSQVFGLGKGLKAFIKAYFLAKKLCKEYDYDLIDVQDPHLTGLLGFLLKKKFDKKLEIHFHGDFWDNKFWLKESWKNRVFYILQKFITFKADAIRVVNQSIKDALLAAGLAEDKISVINTPVNEKIFAQIIDQNLIQKIQAQYQNKKIILFVGRLVLAKNILFLLQIIKDISQERQDFVLLLIGDGEQKKDLADFIETNQLASLVKFLPAQKHEVLVNYYQAAYLNILLSTNESFAKVVIEAGFSSLATLASRSLGPASIIQDGENGFLVSINDFQATKNRLNILLDSTELVQKVGKKAKIDFIAKYSQSASYQKVKNFWLKITNSH